MWILEFLFILIIFAIFGAFCGMLYMCQPVIAIIVGVIFAFGIVNLIRLLMS